MLKLKILTLLFSLKVALCSNCHVEKRKSGFSTHFCAYKITKIGRLPKAVNESSGLAAALPDTTFWTHNDGRGNTALYKITSTGKLLDTLSLTGIRNKDWEDLAQDRKGNLYIGDFGNNTNKRKDLTIYKVDPQKANQIDSITFRYSDQKNFPPSPKDLNFDAEAFFWYADSLYIFSKNRGNKRVKLYTLPDQPGDYIAQPSGQIFLNNQVTAADINQNQTLFALLSYGKVYLFRLTNKSNLLTNPYLCIKVPRNQAEALVFINDTDFLITNEQGKLYLVEKRKKKPRS